MRRRGRGAAQRALIKVAVIAGIVAVVVAELPDLKRYVEISRM
ncbi:MAG TPA: hypothetical protein VFO01_15065 [Trebonia sp.]|nr:hypothetical protein [Trebonia sp.]